jgi:alanyl aminopeptidase
VRVRVRALLLSFVALSFVALQGLWDRAALAQPATDGDAAAVELGEPPQGKLPEGVRPVHYVVELDVDPAQPRFRGKVQVEVAISQPTRVVWMHGRGLDVRALEVVLPDGTQVPAAWRQVTPDGVAAVTTATPLPAGRVTFRFTYEAAFDDQLAGLYRVHVADAAASGGGRHYAFTQFEAIDARRALPCFDEPRFKTPWAITLRIPAGLAAFSNSPESSVTPLPDGRTEVRFQPSPPLPSYLVAFVVGEFDVVEWQPLAATALRDRAVPLRGIAVKGQGPRLRRALALTEPMVTRLERYFDQPYPFDKLDLVAVPDFAAGAMENAGLITYRDTILLTDDDATEAQRRRMVVVHAHELSHQWLGDLVTPPWWDDIWLNESFATWMERKVAQDIDPAGRYDRSLLLEVQHAMDVDSLATTRRIREPVLGPAEIATAFDQIAYQKGGAVLVMLEGYLGVDRMREGMQRYLRRHAGGTATSDDLIRALAEGNGGAEFTRVVESFLTLPGVPMLDVRAQCRGGQGELVVKQQRYEPIGFRLTQARRGDAARGRGRAERWTIPFCFRTDAAARCELLSQGEQRIALGACPAWVMPNAGANGYYRFRLDERALAALLANVDALPDREQLALADSVVAAFRAGDLPFDAVLALARRLASAPQHEVALALVEAWVRVHWQWLDADARAASAAQLRALYGPVLARLDVRQPEQRLFASRLQHVLAEVGMDTALRTQLAEGAMRYLALPPAAGHATAGHATAGASAVAFDDAALPREDVAIALRVAVAERGDAAIDLILRRLAQLSDGTRRAQLVGALAAASTPATRARVQALVLAATADASASATTAADDAPPAVAQRSEKIDQRSEKIDQRSEKIDQRSEKIELRRNEVDDLLWAMLDEARLGEHWPWLREHVDALVRNGSADLAGYAPLLGASLCDAKSLRQLRETFAERARSWPGGERTLAQAEAAVQTCVALREAQEDSVREALGTPG